MFENPIIMDRFLNYWRKTGFQVCLLFFLQVHNLKENSLKITKISTDKSSHSYYEIPENL